MKDRKLGNIVAVVSHLALGAMTFGDEADDHTTPDLVAEAQAYLGATFEVFTYDAGHAFANDVRPGLCAGRGRVGARARASLSRRPHRLTAGAWTPAASRS